MRNSALALAVCALASIVLAPDLNAQTLRGQVVDSVTRAPVGSGFVVLLGANDAELDRTLTTWDGRFTFHLSPGHRGPFRLRSERIGYRVAQTEPFDVPASGTADFTLWLAALPTPLSAIEVRGTTECKVRPREDEQTAVVWEEARKALAAASWTASRQLYHVVSTLYDRDMDGRRRVHSERHRPSIGSSTNPFASRDPDELVRDGYVVQEIGTVAYSAPDAHVLQSEGFLETHCFQLRLPDRDGDNLIGLAFKPVPSRKLPDVEGVLWLERGSSELQSIEYRYTNLPPAIRTRDPAGGAVHFMALPSGAWIVHRWETEIPTAFRMERDRFDRPARRVVDAYRAVGGEVLTITDRAGTRVYETELADLVGVVIDSIDGEPKPLAGARVLVVGTWFADTTDQRGRFHLRAPLDGEYDVTFTHERIDSLGFTVPPREVILARGRTDTTSLTVPPMQNILASLCPDHRVGAYARALVGTVRDSLTGKPIPGVKVVASWQRIRSGTKFSNYRDIATTDGSGRYTLCGLDFGQPTMVYAVGDDSGSEPVRVAFEVSGVAVGEAFYETNVSIWRHNLMLRPQAGIGTLAGFVTDATTGRGIPGATVTIDGLGAASESDPTGTFQVRGLSPGTHRLTLWRPGYNTRRGEVEVAADQPTIIGAEFLTLTPVPQVVGTATESETNTPVSDVWMTLMSVEGDSVKMTRSDSLGAFVLTAPEPGPYHVRARRVGYAPGFMGPFQLEAGQAVNVEFSLRQLAFALDPLNVTAEAVDQYLNDVGFYRRQKANRGHFMDRTAIEMRLGQARDVTDLLTHLPGVGIADNLVGSSGAPIDLRRGVNSFVGCTGGGPAIYVDGFPIGNTQLGGFSEDDIPAPAWLSLSGVAQPEDVYGIEIYRTPSQVPVEYGGAQAMCGVLLIWTTRGGH